MLQRLIDLKFRPAFEYHVSGGAVSDFQTLDTKLWNSSRVVYARTYGDQILYVGKTNNSFGSRMRGHINKLPKYSAKKDLNYRLWAEGKTIIVFALAPPKRRYRGLELSIHNSLEEALIVELQPKYNARVG